MAYNHAGAEKAYALQQEENRKQYRAAGMSDEEIQEIEKYDRSVFLSDRRFYENTSDLGEDISDLDGCTFGQEYEELDISLSLDDLQKRVAWIQTIQNESLLRIIMKLPLADLELLTLRAIQGKTVIEIADMQGTSHQAVSKRWRRIKKVFQKILR